MNILFKGLCGISFGANVVFGYLYNFKKDRPVFYNETVSSNIEVIKEVVKSKKETLFHGFYNTYTYYLNKNKLFVSKNLVDLKTQCAVGQSFAIKHVKFNENIVLKNNASFKNIMFALLDSQFGYLALTHFGKKPCATAHIEYQTLKEIKAEEDYYLFAYIDKEIGRNVWINGIVLNNKGEIMSKYSSRFAKINWKNTFVLK